MTCEDAPCCGCCGRSLYGSESEDYYADEYYDDDYYDDSMDGDHASALASVGWGTDEDYGGYDDGGWE